MMLDLFRKNITNLSKFLIKLSKIVSTGLLILLSSIIVANVALRYVFQSPLSWADEIARLLIVWVVCFAMGIAFQKGLHIGVTFLLESLPKKIAQGIVFSSKFLLLASLAVLTKDGLSLTIHSARAIMPASGIAQAWLYIPVPLGSIFIIVYLINDILNGPEGADLGRGK
jgi:TRAP-type C4-dicarboxylate transport system permease small subunit